jgi:hypothetical protein
MASNRFRKIAVTSFTTTDATLTTALTITIPTGKNISGRIMAISRNTSNTNSKDYQGPCLQRMLEVL